MERNILTALEEKNVFIGYYMLCRYLNGKGYNGKHIPKSNPKNRVHPCKILCPESEVYHSRVRYWCKKLEKENKLFLEKMHFYDSNNPNSTNKPHKLDLFIIIAKSKEVFDKWRDKHCLNL